MPFTDKVIRLVIRVKIFGVTVLGVEETGRMRKGKRERGGSFGSGHLRPAVPLTCVMDIRVKVTTDYLPSIPGHPFIDQSEGMDEKLGEGGGVRGCTPLLRPGLEPRPAYQHSETTHYWNTETSS